MPAVRRADSDSPRTLKDSGTPRASESGRLSPAAARCTAPKQWLDSLVAAFTVALVLVFFGFLTVAAAAAGQDYTTTLIVVAIVFAFAPLIDELPGMKRLAGTMPVGATYTCWNCLLLTYTAAVHFLLDQPPLLLPCVVANSWAIFVSFNVVRVFDASLYRRAAEWTGYSVLAFHVFNQVFHTLPMIAATVWFAYSPDGSCELSGVASYLTISFHFLYAMRIAQSLFLDKVYFECPKWQWGIAWTSALLTHLTVGKEVAWQCSAAAPW